MLFVYIKSQTMEEKKYCISSYADLGKCLLKYVYDTVGQTWASSDDEIFLDDIDIEIRYLEEIK